MAGNIKVVKPGKNYEQVSKAIIFDDRIDLATLGFFCKVISLSEKWQLNVAGLSTLMHISTGKVQKCLGQLETAGYLKRVKVQDKQGHFKGWDYTFYNLPIDPDKAIYRQSENTDVGKTRQSEKRAVYNRPISNNRPLYNTQYDYKEKEEEKDIDLSLDETSRDTMTIQQLRALYEN